jgi:hypothetical protein
MEVAPLPGGGAAVRHSGDRTSEPLTVNKPEWLRFVSCVKNDEFAACDHGSPPADPLAQGPVHRGYHRVE